MTTNALVRAMSAPDFYPHRPERVEVRESHISWVFLAGETVYKLKKPVRFEFLDYSTRERRRFFCDEEVRLNRRLAPSVYMGVLPVLGAAPDFHLGEEPGDTSRRPIDVVDHVVKMRRLPDEWMLDRRLVEGLAGADELSRIAAKLAVFHGSCGEPGSKAFGSAERIRELVETNLRECLPFIPDLLTHDDFHELAESARSFVAAHADLFARRMAAHRIREGHGDLRAEHVCLAGDIDIFDCIEFSEPLRTCDVAAEIAFLAMDLDFLGFPLLADGFAERYAAITGDPDLPMLMPFYKSYRAEVRAKVDGLKSRREDLDAAEAREAADSAERHFRLALRYSRKPRRPLLVIVCGLSGTGKSTVARALADLSGFAVESSDVVRKGLAGLPRAKRPDAEERARLYAPSFTERTYRELLRRAEGHLEDGRGVIVDATFQDSEHRGWFLDLADRQRVEPLFLECRVDDQTVARRLRQRGARSSEASDATWPVYLRQRRAFTAFPSGVPHRIVDTGGEARRVRRKIEALLA